MNMGESRSRRMRLMGHYIKYLPKGRLRSNSLTMNVLFALYISIGMLLFRRNATVWEFRDITEDNELDMEYTWRNVIMDLQVLYW